MCLSMLVSPRVMRTECQSIRAPSAKATELGKEESYVNLKELKQPKQITCKDTENNLLQGELDEALGHSLLQSMRQMESSEKEG